MTDEQRARKIAKLAWEIQPNFRTRFRTEEELAEKLIEGTHNGSSMLGVFLPVCILEVLATAESYKGTLAHAELDSIDGTSTVSSDEIAIAKLALSQLEPIIPQIENHCDDWAQD